MTATQALGKIVGSNDYTKLRYIIERKKIGEIPEEYNEMIDELVHKIERAIKSAGEELSDSERDKFDGLLAEKMEGFRLLSGLLHILGR